MAAVLYTPDGPTLFVGSGAPQTQAVTLAFGQILGADQTLLLALDDVKLVPVSTIGQEYEYRQVYNNTGGDYAMGEVVCWKAEGNARQEIETPSSTNIYLPAGVIYPNGIADGQKGYVVAGGKPHYAKVLGSSGLTKRVPLAPVAGQNYLAKVASPLTGVRYFFYAEETWETAQVAHKLVTIDCPRPFRAAGRAGVR